MFVTQEILERRGACKAGQKWFSRHYPNGAEMIEVIRNPKVAHSFLYWGYEHLCYNEMELNEFLKKLNIEVKDYRLIYRSLNIKNSEFISQCTDVSDSSYIFKSVNVFNSNNIVCGKTIENSYQCFESGFVFNSDKIMYGTNINDSSNILKSNFIIKSQSVVNSSIIENSNYINNSQGITNSSFISNSQNLQNCLFCYGIANEQNMVFNKPVSEKQIALIKQQLLTILKNWESQLVIGNWPDREIPLRFPTQQLSPYAQYKDLPTVFWDWIKTLPGYDEVILFRITLNNKAYLDKE